MKIIVDQNLKDRCPARPAERGDTSIATTVSRPFFLLDLIFWVAFLIALAHLCLAGLGGVLLPVFLPPPLVAVACLRSRRASTRFMSRFFLAAIGLGDVVAYCLPQMHHSRLSTQGMSTQEATILEWFLVVYLVFFFILLPPFLLIRPLVDRRHGRRASVSPITSCLGLLAWLLFAPVFFLASLKGLFEG